MFENRVKRSCVALCQKVEGADIVSCLCIGFAGLLRYRPSLWPIAEGAGGKGSEAGVMITAAMKVAEDLGVALPSELGEVAAEIADAVGTKPLEKRRFLRQ